MIELYFWPTPNGFKPLVAMEELGIAYEIKPVDIHKGEQFDPAFLAIAPNNRIPAIVDHDPGFVASKLALFESGAILNHLAEKGGALQGKDRAGWLEVQQWLHWQVAGLGPNMGQAGHFHIYATEDVPYAKSRFVAETERLLGVMERRLADRDYLAGEYSIADIACYPWLRLHTLLPLAMAPFERVAAWMAAIGERPAVKRAYEAGGRFGAPPAAERSETQG